MGSLRAEPKTRDRVLVVDGRPQDCGLVRMYLGTGRFESRSRRTALGPCADAEMNPLMVLTWMLPGVDGHAVARISREEAGIRS